VSRPSSKQLKIAGLVLLAIPALFLAALALGEGVVGGDVWGLQHVAQLAPLVVVAWLAWRQPFWGGVALIALTLVFTVLYFIFIHGFPLTTVLPTLALLFVPPLVAGVLFVLAARQDRQSMRGPGDPATARP
jgi:hypothetical protein